MRSPGTTDAVVVPLGFLSDHMEVLYDLDVEARELAERLGLHYVRAGTAGNDFPTTPGAWRGAISTTTAAFAAKLGAAGNTLVYSTYVPFASNTRVAVDGSGNAYVGGQAAVGFSTTSGAFQTAIRTATGGAPFALKLNAGGTDAIYATDAVLWSNLPSSLRFTVAHEMAHVTKRHSMRQLIYAGGVLPLVGLLVGQPDAAALVQNLGQLAELRFSRSQEEVADLTGFETLVAARVSTEGMARFFDRLAKMEGGTSSFLSTHPSSAGRAEAIRARAKAFPATPVAPFDIDWATVKAAVR